MMLDVLDIKKAYWDGWKRIKEERETHTTFSIHKELTDLADSAVAAVAERAGMPANFTLLALGGYGRSEMAPHSDIDILILHAGEPTAEETGFINLFTTCMWDIGVKPGIQLKDIHEVEAAALADEIIRTSLIDNRIIAGNEALFADFNNILNERILERGTSDFLMQKIAAVRNRFRKYRDSVYRLEPNLKEGEGGVRDVNTVKWITRVLFRSDDLSVLVREHIITEEELRDLTSAAEHMFGLRNELHYFHNRKYDVLTMDAQVALAARYGYESTYATLAVEQFMRKYYFAARDIVRVSGKVVSKTLHDYLLKRVNKQTFSRELSYGFTQYGNTISIADENIFIDDPGKMLTLFRRAAESGFILSSGARDMIQKHLYLIDDKYRKKYGQRFVRLLSYFPYVSRIVTMMLETGFLSAMIPQFEEIVCKPQFNMYHHYTVDEHTIIALKYIDKLSGSLPPSLHEYQDAFRNCRRKDLLGVALLLHDIGKGQGKNHSVVGAHMARTILKRLGVGLDDIDSVANLVEQHLLMSHISQRRDLHSIDVIHHFISFLNNADELHVLYLLTYADLNAVGGESFNEWKNRLLTELYLKAKAAFEQDDMQSEFKAVVESKRARLMERIGTNAALAVMVSGLEDDFVFSYKIKHIQRYLTLARSVCPEDPIRIETAVREDLNCYEVTVSTYDSIGLLKKLAGALSSLGYNILGAQIHTLEEDIVVDSIQFTSVGAEVSDIEDKREMILKRIHDTILGTVDIGSLVKQASLSAKQKKKLVPVKSKVEFDNQVSSNSTVVDVFAADKIGLLYSILGVLERLRLNVQKAKISTDVDRIVDTFYITDLAGQKIWDENVLSALKSELLREIDE